MVLSLKLVASSFLSLQVLTQSNLFPLPSPAFLILFYVIDRCIFTSLDNISLAYMHF